MFFVAKRFALVGSRGRTAVTSFLSALGIAFGVMTLIVILSVMNGFQMGYIESILEVSSFHVLLRRPGVSADAAVTEKCLSVPGVVSVTPFLEAQTLMVSAAGRQQGVLLRAVPPDIMQADAGFAGQVKITAGSFNLASPSSAVLGAELARNLGARPGDTVTLLAVSGGADTDLFSSDRTYTVTGLFKTGYYEIDTSFAFISLEDGRTLFGAEAPYIYGLKLKNTDDDMRVAEQLRGEFPSADVESWRSYNRSFFGALRVEKIVLRFRVGLIIDVVGVNIFSSMRRMVYERREEISVLSALGARSRHIQMLFVSDGFIIGFGGSVAGLLLGLLVRVSIDENFGLIAAAVNNVLYFVSLLFSGTGHSSFSLFSPVYFYLTKVPSRVLFGEVVWICLFGIFSAVAAAWAASRGILKLSAAEVLRDE